MIVSQPAAHAIAATDRPGIETGDGCPQTGSCGVAAELREERSTGESAGALLTRDPPFRLEMKWTLARHDAAFVYGPAA